MADWLKRITAFIASPKESAPTPAHNSEINGNILQKLEDLPLSLLSEPAHSVSYSKPQRLSQAKTHGHPKTVPSKMEFTPSPLSAPPTPKEEEKNMANVHEDEDDNLKALKHLRELPRGTQVESRIAAVKNLLGEMEIFKTLKMLRWPQGVVCPKCHSSNVVRKEPPADAIDKRHYYICLNCKGTDGSGDFDDFTGLPIGSIHALRQWILCWYLIGFCSVTQIAKVLGISIQEVMQIATLGNDLAAQPDADPLEAKSSFTTQSKKDRDANAQKAQVHLQEDYASSESKSPFKPGYKSKK